MIFVIRNQPIMQRMATSISIGTTVLILLFNLCRLDAQAPAFPEQRAMANMFPAEGEGQYMR